MSSSFNASVTFSANAEDVVQALDNMVKSVGTFAGGATAAQEQVRAAMTATAERVTALKDRLTELYAIRSQGNQTEQLRTEISMTEKALKSLNEDLQRYKGILGESGHEAGGFTGHLMEMAFGFGTMAGAGMKAMDLVFEGIKSLVEIIPRAIEQTNKLVETFETIHATTGMSLGEFNKWAATAELAGMKAEDLTELINGMGRGLRQNSENLIANKVFTDEAALAGMDFGEKIHAIREALDRCNGEQERQNLLRDAMSRSGPGMAAALEKLDDEYARGAVLGRESASITELNVEATKRLREATAALNHEKEVEQGLIQSGFSGYAAAAQEMAAEALHKRNLLKLARELNDAGKINAELVDTEIEGIHVLLPAEDSLIAKAKEYLALKDKADKAAGKDTGKKSGYDAELAAKKKDQEKAAAEAAKAAEEKEAMVQQVLQRKRDQDAQSAQARADQADQRAMNAREKANNELIAEMAREAREEVELAKLKAADKVDAYKSELAERKQALDQEVALGRISAAEELQTRKDLSKEEEDLEVKALQKELQTLTLTQVEYQKIENQISAIHRKGTLERSKLDKDAAVEGKREADFYGASIANAGSSTLTTLVTNHKNAGAQIKAVWADMAGAILKHLADIEAKKLADMVLNQKAATSAVTGAAETNAANESTIGPSTEATTANLGQASSGIFSSFSSVPWVGVALAIAAIAAMMAVMKSVTAHAEGGVIDHPILALMGEGQDTEIVANETSFKEWGNNTLQMGAALARANMRTEQVVQGYNAQGSSYASGAREATANGSPGGDRVFDARGAMILDHAAAQQSFDRFMDDSDMRRGKLR